MILPGTHHTELVVSLAHNLGGVLVTHLVAGIQVATGVR
jgi:hypothetical protein